MGSKIQTESSCTLATMLPTQTTRYLVLVAGKDLGYAVVLEYIQNYLRYTSVIKPLPTVHRVLDFILSTKYLGGREDDILERHLSGLSEISHLLGEVSRSCRMLYSSLCV